MICVKIKKLDPRAKTPAYHSAGASGMDLHALESVEHEGRTPVVVGTGIALQIPPGYEAQVRPRSSLSRRGITCAIGTIDSDYTGEIGALLSSQNGLSIKAGDRIAQIVFAPVEVARLHEVDELADTERSTGGWGSTGT